MENLAKHIAILNLTGELPQELADYCAKRGLRVIDPLVDTTKLKWSHILTKELHDFKLLKDTYGTFDNDIKVISLSQVNEIQNFVMGNGKLVYDEAWLKSSLGEFIWDKFFQEYGGITIGDNYPTFKEKGSFNVTNPFNTGEYLDQMVHHAFEGGVAALSMKTFFDHLLMYLSGLKNKGKVGMPIEVTYGVLDDIFGVQIHFFTKDLLLEDVTACLSSTISKKAEDYLLNVAVKSADFFDFTYLSQVNKVVVTGLWTRNEAIKVDNRGIMFANLSSAATLTNYPAEGVTSSLVSQTELTDQTEKIVLPDRPELLEEGIKIPGKKFSEAIAERISSALDLEKIKQILNGDLDVEKVTEFDLSKIETEDGKVILSSFDEMNDAVNLVKGGIEEENQIMKIGGGPFNPDNFAVRVSSALIAKAEEEDSMRLKALGSKLPEKIRSGLFDFAKGLNKDLEALTVDDIEIFQNDQIPQLIMSQTEIMGETTQALLKDFRSKLDLSIRNEFNMESSEEVLAQIKTLEEEFKVKDLLKDTLQVALDTNFELSKKNVITKLEQDLLIKSLSTSLEEEEEKIRAIVTDEKLFVDEINPLFQVAPADKAGVLENKLKESDVEREALVRKMKALMAEIKLLREMNAQMTKVQIEASQAAIEGVTPRIDEDEELRNHFMQKLAQQEGLNEHDQQKLSSLLEREAKHIAEAKQIEMRAKKQQIEATQKQALLLKELEKTARVVKARDLMLVKTKEAFGKMTEKKDADIMDLQGKIAQMAKSLANSPTHAQATAIRDLEKQNQNLSKMLEVYKIKVASLASNMQSSKNEDGNTKEEIRKIQMVNNQLKNQLDYSKKELSKFHEKAAHDSTQINALRQEKTRLEQLLKKTMQEDKQKETSGVSAELEQNYKKMLSQNQQLESALRDTTVKMKDLEIRLAEIQKEKKSSSGPEEGNKVKMGQLEGNVKKLTSDLTETRNQLAEMKKETNKLRQEKTSLQNQLDKLRKDTEKSDKKKGGGKAA